MSVVRKPQGGRSPRFRVPRCSLFEGVKALLIRIRVLSVPSREETLELPILWTLERRDVNGCQEEKSWLIWVASEFDWVQGFVDEACLLWLVFVDDIYNRAWCG